MTTTTGRVFRQKRLSGMLVLVRLCLLLPLAGAKFHSSGSQERQHQRFAMEPQDQTAIVGSRVTLPCRVVDKTGYIQWTKNDFGLGVHRNLSGYERYSMVGSDEEGDFSLDISPVMLDDNAEYQCQVSPGANGAPAIRSRKAQITVLVPPEHPKIVKGNASIDEIVATEDREIELECVSSGGKPAAEINWIDGNGNVLTSGIEYMKNLMTDNKRFEARSILKLIPKREHHNTTITCQALNSADRQEKTAKLRLTVKYAPKVTVSVISGALANEKIPEGAEVRLACQAEANPGDLTYRWYINGEAAIGDFTTEMIIHNISRKYHEAAIKCEVANSVGKSEASQTLEIRYGPAFRGPLKSVEADEGDTVTLSCNVGGNPQPDIEWIFNPSGKTVGRSANLTLTVTNDHVGSYTCRASVMGIFIEAEASIHLKGPPSITSARKQFGAPGETVQIECTAFSVPKVKHILWSYNGRDINGSSRDEDYEIFEDVTSYGIKSTLVIHRSDTKHFGRYNCSVANDYGHDNMEILLSGIHDSQVTYVFIVLAIILFIVMVAMISVICIKSGKRKLPPADMISEHHITEKSFKDSDRFSNTSELKDPDRDYSEYSGTESTATRTAINILGNGHAGNGSVPLAGPVKLPNHHLSNNGGGNHRFSGDYSDMHVAQKVGLTNNGYIPYNDYTRDYSPPNSMRANMPASLKGHLIASSGHSPLMSATPVTTMNSAIDSYTLGRARELRQDNGLPTIPLNTMPNGIINQSLLNNVDIRYSATYGNPYLKNSSTSPLPPPPVALHKPYTANPSVTPAPPPYNRSNNSNSSFSSSTTISNSGSLMGGVTNNNTTNTNNNNNINNNSNSNHNNNNNISTSTSVGLSYPNSGSSISTGATVTPTVATAAANTQITSPSRQFILPANGDLKKGSLATHV